MLSGEGEKEEKRSTPRSLADRTAAPLSYVVPCGPEELALVEIGLGKFLIPEE